MSKRIVNIFMLKLAIIISVLSQVDTIESIFRPVMYIVWLIVVAAGLIDRKLKIELSNYACKYLFLYSIWLIVCIVLSIIGTNHLSGNYLRVMIVPALMIITADLYKDDMTLESLESLCKVYVVCAFTFAIWVHLTYFPSYANWLQMQIYAYSQKNSAAQIWCSSILIIIFVLKPKSKIERTLWYGVAVYLFVVAALSQCRTALLAIGFAGIVYAVRYTKYRAFITVIIIGICIFMWNNPVTRRFINQTFLLEKYAGADLNAMSSGRLDYWQEALGEFSRSPLVGVGKWYVDCSYISILAEGGIIGFIIIERLWIGRIAGIFLSNSSTKRFLITLVCFYLVESFLEGFPPFGPGVSSFMFWFLSELIVSDWKPEMTLENNNGELKEKLRISNSI